jgi:uncharacterized protein YlaI
MTVTCPGCEALIADLPTRTWEMKNGHDRIITVIKTYACPKCNRKFRTGQRVSGAPQK